MTSRPGVASCLTPSKLSQASNVPSPSRSLKRKASLIPGSPSKASRKEDSQFERLAQEHYPPTFKIKSKGQSDCDGSICRKPGDRDFLAVVSGTSVHLRCALEWALDCWPAAKVFSKLDTSLSKNAEIEAIFETSFDVADAINRRASKRSAKAADKDPARQDPSSAIEVASRSYTLVDLPNIRIDDLENTLSTSSLFARRLAQDAADDDDESLRRATIRRVIRALWQSAKCQSMPRVEELAFLTTVQSLTRYLDETFCPPYEQITDFDRMPTFRTILKEIDDGLLVSTPLRTLLASHLDVSYPPLGVSDLSFATPSQAVSAAAEAAVTALKSINEGQQLSSLDTVSSLMLLDGIISSTFACAPAPSKTPAGPAESKKNEVKKNEIKLLHSSLNEIKTKTLDELKALSGPAMAKIIKIGKIGMQCKNASAMDGYPADTTNESTEQTNIRYGYAQTIYDLLRNRDIAPASSSAPVLATATATATATASTSGSTGLLTKEDNDTASTGRAEDQQAKEDDATPRQTALGSLSLRSQPSRKAAKRA